MSQADVYFIVSSVFIASSIKSEMVKWLFGVAWFALYVIAKYA